MNAAASWRLLAASPCEESESGTRKHGIQLHIKEGGGLRFCLVICHICLVGVLFYIVGHDLFVRFFLIFFNVEIIFVSLVAYWTRAASP